MTILQRNYPLAQHRQAYGAACLAESTRTPAQYNALHRSLFAQESDLSAASLRASAVQAGLNPPVSSSLGAKRVNADMALAKRIGIKQVPTIFLCDASGVREVSSVDTLRLLIRKGGTNQ